MTRYIEQQTGRIEPPFLHDGRPMQIALELQAKRKAAGLIRPQMANLLGISNTLYEDFERCQAYIPPRIMAQIDAILTDVASGKITPPIFYEEV
jgi:transcriptional regulator with XRE-family HTH domain